MKTEIEKVSYSLGLNIAGSLQQQGFVGLDAQMLGQAIGDALSGAKLKIDPQEAGMLLNEYFGKMQAKKHEEAIKVGDDFLGANKKKEGVISLESGLQYEILTEGKGEKPSLTSTVTTHYHGTTIDGNIFDSSVQRGTPASFPVNGVIAGWTEALQLMPVGSKWRLYVPSNLAYGAKGAGDKIGPYATLIFEVELLEIK